MTTLLPQVRDQLDRAAWRRAGTRRSRVTPGSIARATILAGAAIVPVVIIIGALILVRGGAKPPPSTKPSRETTIQRLVDILAVLRRPQTNADLALPDSFRQAMAGPSAAPVFFGAPDLRLARLATVTPWGQKVFVVPMSPLSAAQIARIVSEHPGLAQALQHRGTPSVGLGLFAGGGEIDEGSAADIEAGREFVYDGAGNSILGLVGSAPPIRVVMVVPDGVAKVTFILPRQAYPGAIPYPAPQTITVAVRDNIAAFETARYIEQEHRSRVVMIWYSASGAVVKRIGDFSQLDSVLPDPSLNRPVGDKNPSSWDSVAVAPLFGGRSTTFTVAFRRPVSGAYRYAYRFSGPSSRAGCYSPVSRTPIIRGPDLGIPSTRVGQIASTEFGGQAWCPGSYRVSVALVGSRPFSTATFTVRP